MSDQWDMSSLFGADHDTKKLTPPPVVVRRAVAKLAAQKAGDSPVLQEALMKKLMRELSPRMLEKLTEQLKQSGLLRLYIRPEMKPGRKIAKQDEKEAKQLAERMAQWDAVMQRAAEEAEDLRHQRQPRLAPAPVPLLQPEEFAWLYGLVFGVRHAWVRCEALLAEQNIKLNEAQMDRFQDYVLQLSGVSQQPVAPQAMPTPFRSISEELQALFAVVGETSSSSEILRVQQVAISSAELVRNSQRREQMAEQPAAAVIPLAEYLTSPSLFTPFESGSVNNVVPLFGQGRKHDDEDDHTPRLR